MPFACSICRSQKKVSDTLELESHLVVSSCVGPMPSGRAVNALLTGEPFLQPPRKIVFINFFTWSHY